MTTAKIEKEINIDTQSWKGSPRSPWYAHDGLLSRCDREHHSKESFAANIE